VEKLKRSGKLVVLLVVMLFLVLLILGFNHRVAQYRQLAEQAERLEVSVTMLQQTQRYLETQVAYATSEASVEEWAYREGRWIREGDHLVVPYSSVEHTPTPRPQFEATSQALATWEIWRILFFEQLP
jgi:cell division protein FtsB